MNINKYQRNINRSTGQRREKKYIRIHKRKGKVSFQQKMTQSKLDLVRKCNLFTINDSVQTNKKKIIGANKKNLIFVATVVF